MVIILIRHYIYALLHGQFVSFILNFRTNNCKNTIKETEFTVKGRMLNLMVKCHNAANSPVVSLNERNMHGITPDTINKSKYELVKVKQFLYRPGVAQRVPRS